MPQLHVAIVGGRLQGIEAAYLSAKAGFRTVLIDSGVDPPAKSLSDEFHRINIIANPSKAKRVLRHCEAVLPAIENHRALVVLEKLCRELEIPFMQDNESFWMTSDKIESMKFFRRSGIPTPESWPRCGFPVVVKPSNRSGSESVYRADNKRELKRALEIVKRVDENPIVQQFIQGLALSLEVIAREGVGHPLQVTGLEFDEKYGCKRVYAPVKLPSRVEKRLKMLGVEIASNLGLHGLTDVQALLKGAVPRVNEINARLPSQTPTAVYHSTRINMVELLVGLFLEDRQLPVRIQSQQAAIYQHVKVSGKELRVQGEHVMRDASNLRLEKNFFGADEAITNLEPGVDGTNRVATLIVTSPDLASASKKMRGVVGRIMKEYRLDGYVDPSPRRGYDY